MTASTKTVKTAKASKVVKQENVQFVNVLRDALVARQTKLIALDLHSQAAQLQTSIRDLTDTVVQHAQIALEKTDFARLSDVIAYCDDKGKGHEQVKTIVKIATMINAIAANSFNYLDNNTRIGILTLLQHDNHASVREMVAAQSKQAHKDVYAYGVREGFKNLANYSIGTGNSQSAQVRQVLNRLNFFDGFVKGQKGNDPALNEYGLTVLSKFVPAIA